MVRMAKSKTATDHSGLTIIREMKTLHLHISGRVQGVGFRPAVYRIAREMHLNGTVANTADGVHIYVNTDDEGIQLLIHALHTQLPAMVVMADITIEEVPFAHFSDFSIVQDSPKKRFDLWITPDLALCESCRLAIQDVHNRRYQYAFTTCLNCGPRFSIMKALPYERENTTMETFLACPTCKQEYNRSDDVRFYSQTNSCCDCAVEMSFKTANGTIVVDRQADIIPAVAAALKAGSIVAVKGIGGYLLMCDATQAHAVAELRSRKMRPTKPLAVLYAHLQAAQQDVEITSHEKEWLHSPASPIVLCRLKSQTQSGIALHQIAPGLAHLGVMLPYSPLLALISEHFQKPLVATSGNISGCPIEYKDKQAFNNLAGIADYFLTNNREIVVPQDDSVLRCTSNGHPILIRRSRGFAPAVMSRLLEPSSEPLLAMGADMKSCFALHLGHNINVSQYLGKLGTYESINQLQGVIDHMLTLTEAKPAHVLTDAHPNYHSKALGTTIAEEAHAGEMSFQHHKAHFAAVLTENHLLASTEPILGVIWDGTGYGEDGQIWGGETFMLETGEITRIFSLSYFPQLAGDQMSQQPRLSALAVFGVTNGAAQRLSPRFGSDECKYYTRLRKKTSLFTSSMGRLIDAFAALLDLGDVQSYEGEAAMKMEALAWQAEEGCDQKLYPFTIKDQVIDYDLAAQQWITDLDEGKDAKTMAATFWHSLAALILDQAEHTHCDQIALSGGVFQNAYLVDALLERNGGRCRIYLHKEFSPNDENIALGQLALYQLTKKEKSTIKSKSAIPCV